MALISSLVQLLRGAVALTAFLRISRALACLSASTDSGVVTLGGGGGGEGVFPKSSTTVDMLARPVKARRHCNCGTGARTDDATGRREDARPAARAWRRARRAAAAVAGDFMIGLWCEVEGRLEDSRFEQLVTGWRAPMGVRQFQGKRAIQAGYFDC